MMLLQTNSYVVPPEKRVAHAKLLHKFRQALLRLGCDLFEIYEQAGSNWQVSPEGEGRFVQIMRFRDREHQLAVQAAERTDSDAQRLISEFCELINFPYQQEHGLFAVGFYIEMSDAAAAAQLTTAKPRAAVAPAAALPTEVQAPAAPVESRQAKVDVEAYVERELDDIIATFGDPREMLIEPPNAPGAPVREPAAKPFPRLAGTSDAPPADEELDALLEEQFAPAVPDERGRPAAGDSELGRVLDQGLADDALDVPLQAELLEEEEIDGLVFEDLDPAPPAEAAPPSQHVAGR